MKNATLMDKVYHYILGTIIQTGIAPHYTEIAQEFRVTVSKGLDMLHELMKLPLPNWLYPNTDLIASFAPFNNQPTAYRITINGDQRWFAQ